MTTNHHYISYSVIVIILTNVRSILKGDEGRLNNLFYMSFVIAQDKLMVDSLIARPMPNREGKR